MALKQISESGLLYLSLSTIYTISICLVSSEKNRTHSIRAQGFSHWRSVNFHSLRAKGSQMSSRPVNVLAYTSQNRWITFLCPLINNFQQTAFCYLNGNINLFPKSEFISPQKLALGDGNYFSLSELNNVR